MKMQRVVGRGGQSIVHYQKKLYALNELAKMFNASINLMRLGLQSVV